MTDIRTLRQQAGLSRAELGQRIGYTSKQIQRWENEGKSPKPAVIDAIMRALNVRDAKPDLKGSFRFIDLFAGIGGLRIPFQEIGGQCVFTSEWDKHAQQTYCANFGTDHPIAGDITKIANHEVPSHDVLLAGFPCQPFSIAGVSKKNALGRPHGFADETQGTLFFHLARILEYHRPRAFVLENVKNLLTHDKGRTFETIYRVLTTELGYSVQYRVFDAKAFVPQHRERVIIVGFRDPVPVNLHEVEVPPAENGPRLASILHAENGPDSSDEPYTDSLGFVNSKYTLTDLLWDYLQRYAAKHQAKGNGFGYGLVGPDDVARTLSARYYKDGSEILIRQHNRNPRRLTPRECSRLMGFDTPTQKFTIPVSDTQAYKQFGNSVVVPVIRAVAQHLAPYLSSHSEAGQLSLPLHIPLRASA